MSNSVNLQSDKKVPILGVPITTQCPPITEMHLESLLRAICNQPNNESRIAVYADALSECGHIQGEFIALHMAQRKKRLKKEGFYRLQDIATKSNLIAWSKPLSECGTITFKSGIPHEIYLNKSKNYFLESDSWQLIRSIDRGSANVSSLINILRSKNAIHVRTLKGATPKVIEAIIDQQRKLRHLELEVQFQAFSTELLLHFNRVNRLKVRNIFPKRNSKGLFEILRSLTHLKHLELEYMDLFWSVNAPHAFEELQQLKILSFTLPAPPQRFPPNLEKLRFNSYSINERQFAGLSKLRCLDIQSSIPRTLQPRMLDGLSNLKTLVVMNESELGELFFAPVKDSLDKLAIFRGYRIDSTRYAIKTLKNLRELDLDLPPISEYLKPLQELIECMPSLRKMTLRVNQIAPSLLKTVQDLLSNSNVEECDFRHSDFGTRIRKAPNNKWKKYWISLPNKIMVEAA